MQYKDAHRPLPQIAKELNVDAVVEGSVARSAVTRAWRERLACRQCAGSATGFDRGIHRKL
jgi:hypothetical protein